MNRESEAAAGMEVAGRAIIALSDGEEGRALAALNDTTETEIRWAAVYLLSCLMTCVSGRVNHDPRRLGLALKAAAEGIDQDTIETQVAIIVDEAERRGDDD